MHDALMALQILDAEPAEFLTPDAVIEHGDTDGTVALAFKGVVRRRLKQLAGLSIAERRR